MKTQLSTSLGHSLDSRLTAYVASGLALTATMAALPAARASVVYSGTLDYAVPQDPFGVYIDLGTGRIDTSYFYGFDANFYSDQFSMLFNPYESDSGVTADLSYDSPYLVLDPGTAVGPSSTFQKTTEGEEQALLYWPGVNGGIVGLRFLNEVTGANDYGWIRLNTSGPTGENAVVVDYAYDNSGASILAGQTTNAVPEPTTDAIVSLGALALGAASIRRWRQGRPVPAA